MRVVCATDFSKQSEEALPVAARLGSSLGWEVCLVHSAKDKENNDFRDMAENHPIRLEAESSNFAPSDSDRLTTTVLSGSPATAITTFAGESRAALVVLGSSSTSGSKRWFGSRTCESVAETNSSPTMVVRIAKPLLEWLNGIRSLRVVCAYDGTEDSDVLLESLRPLADLGPLELTIAHLYNRSAESSRLGIPVQPAIEGSAQALEDFLERDLRKRITTPVKKVRLKAATRDIASQLLQIAREEASDLIITGTHQWKGLDRFENKCVSRRLVRNSPTNVLCVPLKKRFAQIPIRKVTSVLVATDLSDSGNRAIGYGAGLLPRRGNLHIVHVMHPRLLPNGSYMTELWNPDDLQKHASLIRTTATRLQTMLAEVEELSAAQIHVHVIDGFEPATAICQIAERLGVDVICLHSSGKKPGTAALVGSISNTLVARTRRPVHLVRR